MSDVRAFLDNLVGNWKLTGKMGEIDLLQEVTARWILDDSFLWMHCRSTAPEENPTAKYEAVYHIGYNRDTGQCVMHLLDTTEVPTDCTVGLGALEADQVTFRFEYDDATFFYQFEYDRDDDSWHLPQTYEQDGELKTFAIKEMTRL